MSSSSLAALRRHCSNGIIKSVGETKEANNASASPFHLRRRFDWHRGVIRVAVSLVALEFVRVKTRVDCNLTKLAAQGKISSL